MAKQTFTTGQVLTAAQMTSLQQTALGGGSATAKTANYVLVAADAGTVVAMDAAGATTITVNTALFAAGDTITIQNRGAGVCTVTAGTATVATAGSLALAQNEGGILYFNSTGAAVFYDFVQSGGGGSPSFIGARASKSTSQSISTVTGTAVTFDVEQFDTSSFHSNVTNNSRMTIPAGLAGKYLVVGTFKWAANATGQRVGYIYKNTGLMVEVAFNNMGASNAPVFQISDIVDCAVGDYLELQCYQDSGGSLNLSGGFIYNTIFSIQYLGA